MILWNDNTIQFPRLIAEAMAVGAFTEKVLQDMQDSMDLCRADLLELIDRAQECFQLEKDVHT